MSVDRPETEYDLVADADGLPIAISPPFDVDLTFLDLDTFGNRNCGITVLRVSYCWGAGHPGDGTDFLFGSPVTLVSSTERWEAISVGGLHTCALNEVGAAFCWGSNARGQVGDGSADDGLVPTPVAGGRIFTQLASGSSYTCGLTAGGVVGQAFCWGDNEFGQLGIGATGGNASTPQAVTGGLLFIGIDAGSFHVCGLDQEQLAHCWGANRFGELGFSPASVSGSDVPLALPPARWAQISLGRDHTCGARVNNNHGCMGRGPFLGRGEDQLDSSTPLIIRSGQASLVEYSAGEAGTCALDAIGAAYCWGPLGGWTGDGTLVERLQPAPVSGGLQFKKINPGASHVCGITFEGTAYCWGRNTGFSLGYGSPPNSTVPVRLGRAPVAPVQ